MEFIYNIVSSLGLISIEEDLPVDSDGGSDPSTPNCVIV
jgi:hypothetical protein